MVVNYGRGSRGGMQDRISIPINRAFSIECNGHFLSIYYWRQTSPCTNGRIPNQCQRPFYFAQSNMSSEFRDLNLALQKNQMITTGFKKKKIKEQY